MRIPFCIAAVALLPLFTGCSTTSASKNADPEKARAEMQEKWMQFATPGDAHKVLDQKVGRWTCTIQYWESPDSPAQTSNGTSEIAWIMDGRYIEDHTRADFGGMPFEGRGLTGYDNLTHKYHYTWIDNMGTGFSTGEGDYDKSAKTFKYTTMSPNVISGKYDKSWSTEKFTDKDHWVSEMYGPDANGKEFKMMVLSFTRTR